MPTPLAHSLAGYILYNEREVARWRLDRIDLIVFLVVANIPDLDLLPGFILGNPNSFHHGMTHSIFFGMLVSIALGMIYYCFRHRNLLKFTTVFFAVYSSHLLMDFLGKDTTMPYGEMLFWPFSNDYFISPIAIFSDVYKASSSGIFLQSLFNWHNLSTMAIEAAILIPVLLLVIRKKNRMP